MKWPKDSSWDKLNNASCWWSILPVSSTLFNQTQFLSMASFRGNYSINIISKLSQKLNMFFLIFSFFSQSPGDFQVSKIMLLAVASSTFSVAKTASEAHVMLSSTKIPEILQWLPLLPYFLLTTLTRFKTDLQCCSIISKTFFKWRGRNITLPGYFTTQTQLKSYIVYIRNLDKLNLGVWF